MGQAKQRGTYEERKAAAEQRSKTEALEWAASVAQHSPRKAPEYRQAIIGAGGRSHRMLIAQALAVALAASSPEIQP